MPYEKLSLHRKMEVSYAIWRPDWEPAGVLEGWISEIKAWLSSKSCEAADRLLRCVGGDDHACCR